MTPQWRKSSRSGGPTDHACVEVACLTQKDATNKR